MKRNLKVILLIFSLFIAGAILGAGTFLLNIQEKTGHIHEESVTEGTIYAPSNTTITFYEFFKEKITYQSHTRGDSSSQYCAKSGVTSGSWSSSSITTNNIKVYKNMFLLTSNDVTYTSSSSPLICESCSRYFTGTRSTYGTALTFSTTNSGYGNYTIDVFDPQGYLQNTFMYTHEYRGTLVLDDNGGTGGSKEIVITSNIYSSVAVPTRKGYIFKGYFLSNNYTQIISEQGWPMLASQNFPIFMTAARETLYAKWESISMSVMVEPGIGSYTGGEIGEAKAYYGDYGTCMQIYDPDPPAPSAAYDFTGWTTNYGGDGGGISFLHKDTEFNGTASTAIALGRDRMYTDSFTVNTWVYMDDWSTGSEGTRYVSCTEGAGWALYLENGRIMTGIFEEGYGYVRLSSTTLAANLASGWHMLTVVFDGQKSRMYIDSILEATSSKTFVKGVQYHPTNGIFIGAEPGTSATTPVGAYFKGKMKGVGIFNIPLESYTLQNLYNNKYSSYYCFGETNGSIQANYKYYEPTVTIDPNGGIFTGSTSVTTTTAPRGNTTSLSVPTRDGYIFKGWAQANVSENASIYNMGNLDKSHTDPFLKSVSMYYIYNNSNNGNVVHARVTKPTDLPNTYNSHVLKISNIGTASPSLGGYVKQVQSYANAEFYTVIQAKIPVGYTIAWSSNPSGDGRILKWLTPIQGTGEWENYVCYLKCGATGSFSTTNFFYLIANSGYPSYGTTTQPIEWYVASSAAYDATGMGLNPDAYVSNMPKANTYKFGNANQTLVALWEPDTWERYATTPQIDSADGFYKVTNGSELAYFAKLSKTQHVTAKIKLMNDIDLSAHRWIPIGNATYYFVSTNTGDGSAVLDGHNFTISGLNNFHKSSGYQGLFGFVYKKGIIKNLNLSGTIQGSGTNGGLTGYGYADIRNCIIDVDVVGDFNSGGVVGYNLSSDIINVTNYGNVSGNGSKLGGITGASSNYAKFVGCRNYGNISGNNSVGGIVGDYINGTANWMYLYIEECFVGGTISGTSKVGGLVGNVNHNAKDYTLLLNFISNGVNAKIISTSTTAESGGLIGYLNFPDVSKITLDFRECYFNGSIQTNYANFASSNAFVGNADTGNGLYVYLFNSATLTMADTYVNVNLTKVGVTSTIKAIARSSSTFSSFSFVNGINDGLPVPSGLFWIGGVGGQNNIVAYLQEKGFEYISRR